MGNISDLYFYLLWRLETSPRLSLWKTFLINIAYDYIFWLAKFHEQMKNDSNEKWFDSTEIFKIPETLQHSYMLLLTKGRKLVEMSRENGVL